MTASLTHDAAYAAWGKTRQIDCGRYETAKQCADRHAPRGWIALVSHCSPGAAWVLVAAMNYGPEKLPVWTREDPSISLPQYAYRGF